MFRNLKTLVMMQMKDKIDLSFATTKRGLILKFALLVLQFAAVTVLFYFAFYLCKMLLVFSGSVPDTLLSLIFIIIQLLSVFSCTAELTRALYLSSDNSILLTLPVETNLVFLSKLALYYVFELKKNLFFTFPVFFAYGLVCGGAFYYYPLLLLVWFPTISLVPVAIGAVLSIPTLYVSSFLRRVPVLKFSLIIVAAGGVTYGLFVLINALPANLNIIGDWPRIQPNIVVFLDKACRIFYPFYRLSLMAVGSTSRISGAVVGGDTALCYAVTLLSVALLIGAAFLAARPLFLKMAAKQFEYEKRNVAPKRNVARGKWRSALSESFKLDIRSGTYWIKLFVSFVLPPMLVFLLNKIYMAMNSDYSGQTMTKCFSLLIMLTVLLSFNCEYASVYSKEGAARNLLKTRPTAPVVTLYSRLFLRSVVAVASAAVAVYMYWRVVFAMRAEVMLTFAVAVLLSLAHLLFCAESDIMKPQTEMYMTFGNQFDNPNVRKSTIAALLISVLTAGVTYFFANDRNMLRALIIVTAVSALYFAGRTYLFVTRAKLYFEEK